MLLFYRIKIILILLISRILTIFLLSHIFFIIGTFFNSNNISFILKSILYCRKPSSELFLNKTLEILRTLWILFKIKSNKIFNINKKIYKIKQLT